MSISRKGSFAFSITAKDVARIARAHLPNGIDSKKFMVLEDSSVCNEYSSFIMHLLDEWPYPSQKLLETGVTRGLDVKPSESKKFAKAICQAITWARRNKRSLRNGQKTLPGAVNVMKKILKLDDEQTHQPSSSSSPKDASNSQSPNKRKRESLSPSPGESMNKKRESFSPSPGRRMNRKTSFTPDRAAARELAKDDAIALKKNNKDELKQLQALYSKTTGTSLEHESSSDDCVMCTSQEQEAEVCDTSTDEDKKGSSRKLVEMPSLPKNYWISPTDMTANRFINGSTVETVFLT